MYWAFPEKYCNPPVQDINGKFQGGRVKIEEKTWISRGSMEKNKKFQGGHGKFHRKFRGGQLQKNRYPQQGGYNFFLEKPIV